MAEQAPAGTGLQIVLLGAAEAGKTALLGALAQAAQTQEEALGRQLIDNSGSLAELQKSAYAGKSEQTRQEVIPYTVIFQADTDLPATLVDCDGRVALDFLAGKRALGESSPLALAIRHTDALVLAVAPAEQSQLDQAFGQMTQFLQLLEKQRGSGNEIAGLPVFLVVTKCDLLARPEDTGTAWIQRIEEWKRKIGKRFQDFIDRTVSTPFGRIDLRLWATAMKRPALADRPARPQEPYGVAELFRQVIDAAHAFHDQRLLAQRRLHRAVLGWLLLIAVMGLIAGGFYLTRPSAEVAALENAIRANLPDTNLPDKNQSAADLLREPVDAKLKELTKIQEDRHFSRLPSALQDEVRQAVKEITLYLEYAQKVDSLKRARFFKKEEDIKINRRALDQIRLPTAYEADWANTRLVRKIEQYRSELAALTKALAGEKDWLKKQTEEGDKLRRMAIPAEGTPERQAWIKKADAFLKRKDLTKEVPSVPGMKLRELYEFPSVSSLREDYETVRPRVEKIRGGLQ